MQHVFSNNQQIVLCPSLMDHIKNIRKAVEDDPSHPVYIVTVWGVGYKCAEL